MLTEETTIKSITTDLHANEICVIKEARIMRDGEVIAFTPSKRYFNPSEAEAFAAEVGEGAQGYLDAMGWTLPAANV